MLLQTVRQKLAFTWKEAQEFITALWRDSVPNETRAVVIKPFRGVASDGVFKCHSMAEAHQAFRKLFKSPTYGGGINEAVLVQEFVCGTEYAVDTVACNGDIKVRRDRF